VSITIIIILFLCQAREEAEYFPPAKHSPHAGDHISRPSDQCRSSFSS